MTSLKKWSTPIKRISRQSRPIRFHATQSSYRKLLGCALVNRLCLVTFGVAALSACSTVSAQVSSQAREIEKSVKAAIAQSEKSVVAISRVRKGSIGDPTDPDFIPNQFGCGVVIRSDGTIITNRHLLGKPSDNNYFVWAKTGNSTKIQVFSNVEILAADPWTDLAALKVRSSDLQPIQLADQPIQKGQFAIVIGNPSSIIRTGHPDAAWGIVSGTNKKMAAPDPLARRSQAVDSLYEFGKLIQVDAKLNVGNSGNPVVDLNGQMIGLTTALAPMQAFENGAGLAIPVDSTFKRVIQSLADGTLPEFGFLGIGPRDLSDNQRAAGRFGVQVAEVIPGTPAAKAGFGIGDIITHLNGVEVKNSDDLLRLLGSAAPGDSIKLQVLQGAYDNEPGKLLTLGVRLSKKHIASRRSAFQQQTLRSWQGVRVDYSTAFEGFQSRAQSIDPDGCVAVVEIDRASAAWQAGLRPYRFISHVSGKRVATPNDFYAAVGAIGSTRVTLTVTADGAGKPEKIEFDVQ